MLNDLIADLILTAGNIITINPEFPLAEAVAVKNGQIQAVGSAIDIEQLRGQQTEMINLKGRTVVPGFNDAHNHMASFGLKLQMVLLGYPKVKTIPDLIQALKERAVTQKPDTWIKGAGYDNNKLPGGRHPTRWELDQVSTEHYIVLQHTSGHMCTINSKALELLGIDKNTPDPEGGRIERDKRGEATGLLEEKAQNLASSQFFPHSTESIVDALGAASQQYLAEGITSQAEAGIGMLSHLELLGYQEAVRQGKLKVRSNFRDPELSL
jgi:predicted amidohydrolase YtcJ